MTRWNAAPILVTGLPRSGTTWLAREVARARGLALAGREPMNPRAHQFALDGTLTAWSRLDASSSAKERRTLRRVYRGFEPRVYSRYGVRQWSAALPTTRLVVKDPFALLSLPLLTEVTGARPIILFRHPGALLASYRRMGWIPAVREISDLGLVPATGSTSVPPDSTWDADSVALMSWFWTTCYDAVLHDLSLVPSAVLVDHAELSRGGEIALRELLAACEVPAARLRRTPRRTPTTPRARARGEAKPVLHNFQRTPDDVADSWRSSMSPEDAGRIEFLTSTTWVMLRDRRIRLGHSS